MDLEILYKEYHSAIKGYLKMICRDEELAEDLTQETFIRIQKSLHTFDPSRGSFLGWAKTIGRNIAIRQLQKKGSATLPDTEQVDRAADNRISAEEEIVSESQKNLIKNAIECLPEPEGSIVAYKYRDNLTLDEIAAELNISRRTVSRRYLKALELLREQLDKEELRPS